MKIPKKIKIIANEIDVIFDDSECEKENVWGRSIYTDSKIILKKRLKQNIIDTTFLHEILHWIFFVTGNRELQSNEKLICELSEILYQIIKQIEK